MTITDNATLDWAKTSHPNDTVREVAELMLAAGDRPIDQAERLAELVDDERRYNSTCHICGECEDDL